MSRAAGNVVSLRKKRTMSEESDTETEGSETEGVWRDGSLIHFNADVDDASCRRFLRLLRQANAHAVQNVAIGEATVHVFIHSNGGCVFWGFSLYDTIRANPICVVTCACGYVASAATFLLIAGHRRVAYPNATLLIHQLSGGFWGKFHEMQDEARNSRLIMRRIQHIYLKRTCMTRLSLARLLKCELEMGAYRAKRLGIVDAIVGERVTSVEQVVGTETPGVHDI